MRPARDLPIHASWQNNDEYVEGLLEFVTTSEIFRNLCGGVHILDFLTREPDLYSWVLPEDWRLWFDVVDIDSVMQLLLYTPLDELDKRDDLPPPATLIKYICTVRRLCLDRTFTRRKAKHDLEALPRHVAIGMKPKKIHEVSQFAAFVDGLSVEVGARRETPGPNSGHDDEQPLIVDFGSGQNYLGRTLACPPYDKTVVAIEQRHHNVEGAKGMDISANLAKKEKKMVNKKQWKEQWLAERKDASQGVTPTGRFHEQIITKLELEELNARIPFLGALGGDASRDESTKRENGAVFSRNVLTGPDRNIALPCTHRERDDIGEPVYQHVTTGRIIHVEKALSSGDLNDILLSDSRPSLVVSIHSCGNLTHHGLRSIVLNPMVEAVAMIGCCYNLLTERLGPPTYELSSLRSKHPRLEETSSTFDPHGFPMSMKLEQYQFPIPAPAQRNGPSQCARFYNLNGDMQEIDTTGKGVRLNITARMMAVQAPYNWGPKDSEEFFTRHYFRALLQKILLDLGVVHMSNPCLSPGIEIAGGTLSGKDDTGSPLIIGSLSKTCFTSFKAYVRGATEKLVKDPVDGPTIKMRTAVLFDNDSELARKYETEYAYARKHLSIIWALMAFSAGVVESTIIVDRWLWLKEQDEVEDAWVESVFDYKTSPRNMVVVGIKKRTELTPSTVSRPPRPGRVFSREVIPDPSPLSVVHQ